jgi:predicted transposase YbfD/YdcC
MGEIPGTTITFDALHTRGETHITVVDDNKADYFCIVKKNTKTVLERVESLVDVRVDDTAETFDIGHGRAEKRRVEMLFTTPEEVGYAHGHACGRIIRTREQVQGSKLQKPTEETEYFVASHKDARQRGARFFLDVAREHWAIENKLHHVKDRSMDEDRIRMGGAYARIKAGIGSMAAVTFSDIKGSTNCIQRRIASNLKIPAGLMRCKSLSKWVLEFL